jgi:hypothetical protein
MHDAGEMGHADRMASLSQCSVSPAQCFDSRLQRMPCRPTSTITIHRQETIFDMDTGTTEQGGLRNAVCPNLVTGIPVTQMRLVRVGRMEES